MRAGEARRGSGTGGSLTLRAVEARTIERLLDAPRTALEGSAWLASEPAPGERPPTLAALPDGNRGAIVLDHEVPFLGRAWRLAVKGVGARAPLYGDTPAGYAHAHELSGHLDPAERSLLHAITRESWMGEAPYGGQGLENASHALALSAPAIRDALWPCVLCPVLAVVEVPEREVLEVFYYRRHHGPVVQEHRLVPSTVRLFHQSALALGKDCEGALAALGVETVEALDLFVDRYLASALALLTVGARSVRTRGAGALELLDYDDAWLDKDAFVAPDGSLAFADLEALVYVEVPDEAALAARVRRQVERNAYEALYGADALLRVEERWRERPRDQRARREALAERTALAIATDPALSLIEGREGWELEVRPRLGHELRVRWLDAR